MEVRSSLAFTGSESNLRAFFSRAKPGEDHALEADLCGATCGVGGGVPFVERVFADIRAWRRRERLPQPAACDGHTPHRSPEDLWWAQTAASDAPGCVLYRRRSHRRRRRRGD